jgi:biotin operon repressor
MVAPNSPNFNHGDRVSWNLNDHEKKEGIVESMGDTHVKIQVPEGFAHVPIEWLTKLAPIQVTNNTYNGPVTIHNHGSDRKKKRSAHATHYRLLNNFVDNTMHLLNENQVKVWMFLFRHSHDGFVSLAQHDIGNRTGISRDAVQRAVRVLRKKGLLKIKKKGGYLRGVSTYQLLAFSSPKPHI